MNYNNLASLFFSKFLATTFQFKTHRARFLVSIIWLGATYVLGDMYSAQLTSQLARPAKETPISSKFIFKPLKF